MFEILSKFFRFCSPENRRKFYASIALDVGNSFFLALRIAAVAIMLQGVIGFTGAATAFTSRTVWLSFFVMLVSIAGAIVTKRFSSMLQTQGGYHTCAQKRIQIAEHLRYLPMGYFNANSLGKITSVTTNTMEQLGDVATRVVMMVLQGLLDSALIITMMFFFDWRIALVALAGFVLFQLVNSAMRLSVKGASDEKKVSDTAMVEKVLEYIQGIGEVKAYNLTGTSARELNRVITNNVRANTRMELRCIPLLNLQNVITKLTGVAIMLSSIGFYLNATMTLANCAVMLICSFMLFSALELGGSYSTLLRLIDISVDKAQEILDLPTMDITGKENAPDEEVSHGLDFANAKSAGATLKRTSLDVPNPCDHSLDIEAKDITFSYNTDSRDTHKSDGAAKKIIDGVSLSIPARTTTAIVGPSGGGKTTLCHLLARFWDVDSGEVTLGGKNVRDYDMDSLMAHFSFVFQNVYLFHDTIANNIRFGQKDAPMKSVISAAKKACCHEFISALPNGYDTVIGEGGASLSGGEKQRISIARAIMKNAPIIVLDEATANVDPENERELMLAVSELTREKTVIMIAHRLKTVRNADQILVIDKGRVAERGKHEELIKRGGIYARFVDSRRQAVSWKL